MINTDLQSNYQSLKSEYSSSKDEYLSTQDHPSQDQINEQKNIILNNIENNIRYFITAPAYLRTDYKFISELAKINKYVFGYIDDETSKELGKILDPKNNFIYSNNKKENKNFIDRKYSFLEKDNKFKVKKIKTFTELKNAYKALLEWKDRANDVLDLLQKQWINSPTTSVIEDALSITNSIMDLEFFGSLELGLKNKPTTKRIFFQCLNTKTEEIECLASIAPKDYGISIEYLVTNIKNIPIDLTWKISKNPNMVRGAGTATIKKIKEFCSKHGIEQIKLSSLSSASDFYRKNRFSQTYKGKNYFHYDLPKD